MYLKIAMLVDHAPKPTELLVIRGKECSVDAYIDELKARNLRNLFSVVRIVYAVGDEQLVWGHFLEAAQKSRQEALARIAFDAWQKEKSVFVKTHEFDCVCVLEGQNPGKWLVIAKP